MSRSPRHARIPLACLAVALALVAWVPRDVARAASLRTRDRTHRHGRIHHSHVRRTRPRHTTPRRTTTTTRPVTAPPRPVTTTAPTRAAAPVTTPANPIATPVASTPVTSTPVTSAPVTATTASPGTPDKDVCVYPANHLSLLEQFDQLIGRNVNCVMLFTDNTATWSQWVSPWFTNHTYTDQNFRAWATAPGTHRQLVITVNLFPASEDSVDWLQNGASGAYESYARTLATNLVNAGLGSSIIRLAHEANGTWYPDSLPSTTQGQAQWAQFWRNTVLAMRSVPGAHFLFDWTVNAGYRNIPLTNWYPGDDVVDIIGIDTYDGAVSSQVNRWATISGEAMGVQTVEAFAAAHGKPLSFPEWGLLPESNPSERGGGDDPGFVQGLASVVADDDVAYEDYFFQNEAAMQLVSSPNSLAAYRAAFGASGYAVAPSDDSAQLLPAVAGPALTLTGGPAFDSTIASGPVTFSFSATPGDAVSCSLDGQAWRPCSGSGSDTLTGLAAGYHWWRVQATDAYDAVSLQATDFTVG